MAHSACYRLIVSIFFFAGNWYLLSSSLVCSVESGQTDVAGSFSFANHDWDLRPTNWNLRPQRDLNLNLPTRNQTPFPWAWRTFRFLFRYSQWISWSVKWPSMLSVVSLLPSFALWVMIVSWLLCFRLEAPFGSSNFLGMNAQSSGPQRDSKPRSVESKVRPSVRLWELLRVFPSLFLFTQSSLKAKYSLQQSSNGCSECFAEVK